MIKHLPEGLTPYENCGFGRYPTWPLAGEAVRVACRSEAEPALLLTVNGRPTSPPKPRRAGDRFWRFELGRFEWGDDVRYRFQTPPETTREYAFEPELERGVGEPTGLLEVEDGLFCQVYEDFHILYRTGQTLEILLEQGEPPVGMARETIEAELPEGHRLCLAGNKKGWILKRFGYRDKGTVVASADDYTLRVAKDGRVVAVDQRGRLAGEHVWGTGERYHAVDLRNGTSNGTVTEKFTQQGDQTYLPVPFFMTETGVGCWRDSGIPVALDFRDGLRISQRTQGEALTRDVWLFGTPKMLLRQFIRHTGEPVLPPEWAFGLWISANGWDRDGEVRAQLDALKRYDYPADVIVLEAWSDEQTFRRWNDAAHWKDPAATVRAIRDAGLHLVLWQIPIIKYEWDGEPSEALRSDEREAIENGYCVMNGDGTPYRITENWFHNSLLMDFTNPEAVKWWFGKRKHLLDMGVEGFKTDGGEFLFDHEARLHNGMTGLEAHNLYPGQYIGAYHDFMRANGVEGVTFSRADYTSAQTRPLHWAGDQLSRWSELRAQLRAGLSAGLSGVLFWGFDIGGFAGELPSAELYLRATAMACFSPVMQWHAEPRSGQFYATHEDGFNNDRSPWNLAEKLGRPEILTIGAKFARLRRDLKPYLYSEARHCAAAGRPLMAHLCLDFPRDARACATDDQYMLGRRYMVCPIVMENQSRRSVWLPKGRWRHAFTGEWFEGGREWTLDCPLDEIIVLERGSGYDAD